MWRLPARLAPHWSTLMLHTGPLQHIELGVGAALAWKADPADPLLARALLPQLHVCLQSRAHMKTLPLGAINSGASFTRIYCFSLIPCVDAPLSWHSCQSCCISVASKPGGECQHHFTPFSLSHCLLLNLRSLAAAGNFSWQ